MSNRQRSRWIVGLDNVASQRLPGGCNDCTAYSTVARDDLGVYHLTVHHDDACPWLRARTTR